MRLFACEPVQCPVTKRHVAVRRSVKSIAPDAMTAVEMVGQRVEVSVLGNRRVKSGIEYRHLRRRLAEDLPQGPNSAQVIGIMEGREVDAVLDPLQHLIVDDGRFLEKLAAMHDTVSRGMDVSQTPNLVDPGAIRCEPAQHIVERRGDIADRRSQRLPQTCAVLDGDDRFPANSLHLSTAQELILIVLDSLNIRGNHLELQAGASRIDDEYVHVTDESAVRHAR